MRTNDYVKLILTKIFRNKKNLYFIIQIAICSSVILLTLTFKQNFDNYLYNKLPQNIGFRTITTGLKENEKDDNVINKLKNMEHVETAFSSKYNGYSIDTDFKSNKYDGIISLMYGDKGTLPKIIYGNTLNENDSGKMICPLKFYPSSKAYDTFINSKNIIDGKQLLNNKITATYDSYKIVNEKMEFDKKFTKEFEIVGIYDSEEEAQAFNTCYISAKDMIEIRDKVDHINESANYGYVVVVDKIENVTLVQKKLLSEGFIDADIQNKYDIKNINTINLFSNIILGIGIFIALSLTISYIKKQHLYEQKFIGILKSIGFSKKKIFNIKLIEQFILNFISYILGSILFIIIYLIIKYIVLTKFIIVGFNLLLIFNSFIYSFLMIVIFITIFTIYYLQKDVKQSVLKMIRS